MSRGASLSLLGLYSWDTSLFDTMVFPDGFTANDKQLLVNNLVMDCAELEVLYSDWDFMKSAIAVWSEKEVITWNRIYNASLLEYNPIENYNRTEKTNLQNFGKITNSGKDTMQASGTDTMQASGKDAIQASGKDTMQASGSDSNQASGTDIDTITGTDSTSKSGTDTDTKSRTSYDSNAYANVEKMEMSKGTLETFNKSDTQQHTHGRKDDITYGRKDETTFGRKDETTFGKVTEDTTGHQINSHISGNIGVTTSQQMLEQELDIAPKLNIINHIIDSFKSRFCLLVY